MDKEKQHITEDDSSQTLELMDNLDNISSEELHSQLDQKELADETVDILTARHSFMRRSLKRPNVEKAWKQFQAMHIITSERKDNKVSIKFLYFIIMSAAAIIIALLIIAYPRLTSSDSTFMAFSANDEPQVIQVGINKHMQPITQYPHQNGIIISESQIDFSHQKKTTSSTNTIVTPRGKVYKVILSDGTSVQLNAESRLTFPTKFSGENRIVKLVGEAYFKVTKDPRHPFIVKAEQVTTLVKGTEFNLKAYHASDNNVTLINGSVEVYSNKSNNKVILMPGENAQLSEKDHFHVAMVNTEYYIEWKDGFFYFDNVPLIDVVRELGRWYNVNVEISDNSLASYRLHFIADRNGKIEEIVNNLNSFNYLKVTKEGNKIVIKRKKQ